MTNEDQDTTNDGSSRRSFMKGAAAVAGGYSIMQFDHVLDADGNLLGSASAQDQGANALVFAWQFLPNLDFNLVTEIDNPEDILEGIDAEDGGIDPIANPDEWDAFVISYQTATQYFAIAFFAQNTDVNEGDQFRFSPNASVGSQEFSLMDTDALILEETDGEETPAEEEEETTTTTTTATGNETTTQAVVVDDNDSNNSSS